MHYCMIIFRVKKYFLLAYKHQISSIIISLAILLPFNKQMSCKIIGYLKKIEFTINVNISKNISGILFNTKGKSMSIKWLNYILN